MSADEILRLHYYERQYLGADDLADQQTYLRDMRRRHNVGHHTWGIVTGLMLVEEPVAGDPTAVDVYIQPGMAVDGFGREIFVLAPTKLDPSLFAAFAAQQDLSVWIAYDQDAVNKAIGGYAQCNGTDQFGRIQETYRLAIKPNSPTNDPVTVDGKSVDPTSTDFPVSLDDSIPYQEFPDDDLQPSWLLQLGSVKWAGSKGNFLPAYPASQLSNGRIYAGAVAQTIYSTASLPDSPDPATDAPNFYIQPRTLPSDLDGADFAEIKGRLMVDGRLSAAKDVWLLGNRLQFKDTGGGDSGTALWMQRTIASGASTDLRIHIGNTASANARLSVGPALSNVENAVLAVRADDQIDIATGQVNFGASRRQMLNLWNGNYGIGIQDDTQYFRSDSNFCWYKGGKHSNGKGDAGSGGSLQMQLDDTGSLSVSGALSVAQTLEFGATTRQMIDLWHNNYGIGVQPSTFFCRSDSDFCWYRGGSYADNRDDPGGGSRAMMLDGIGNLSVQGSISAGSNLSVNGNATVSGNLTVSGTQNLFQVRTQTFAVSNQGLGPRPWVFSYPGNFSAFYDAFVVMQGFSIWNNNGNTDFTTYAHAADSNAIPQHAFVRIDNKGLNETSGVCFCSESLESNEGDNSVLFTVVVMGRPKAM